MEDEAEFLPDLLPGTPPVNLLENLTNYGAPFVLLAISLVAIVVLFRMLMQSHKDRLADMKEGTAAIHANTAATQAHTAALGTAIELIKALQQQHQTPPVRPRR